MGLNKKQKLESKNFTGTLYLHLIKQLHHTAQTFLGQHRSQNIYSRQRTGRSSRYVHLAGASVVWGVVPQMPVGRAV